MKINKDYKLLIFDCDGVLVDSEAISCGTIAELSTQLNLPMTTEDALQLFAGTSMRTVKAHLEKNLAGGFPTDFEEQYRRLSYEKYKSELQAVEGIQEVIEHLTIPYCVASNGPREKILMNLKITGLAKYFKETSIFSAYDIQKWKPNPALFLLAAEKGKVAPSDCLVIEDSPSGVKAAQEAGMDVIAYIGHASKNDFGKVPTIQNMRELLD